MSFNPPNDPSPGLTFQYGNIIWEYDAVSGVWNILDGNLVGAQGPKGDDGAVGPTGPTGVTGVTGDPSAGDGAAIIVNGGTVTARLGGYGETGVMGVTGRFSVVDGIATLLPASTGESGIASFDSQFFEVSSTGHVTLVGGIGGATGDTVSEGIGIGIDREGNSVTINNLGVTSFNGLAGAVEGVSSLNSITGTVTISPIGYGAISSSLVSTLDPNEIGIGIGVRLAEAGVTGVASFPATFFEVNGSGAVSLSGPYGIIGVTGIVVKDNGADVALTGAVTITAGTNISIGRDGNTITINSSAVGGGSSITASPQQVLFSSGNGGTGSDNFVFNGLAATFGGANTQFTITGPTFTIGDNTVVRGGVFYDAAESAPYQNLGDFGVIIRAINGSVQRIRIAKTAPYTVSMDRTGWTDVPGVAESVVVILQSENGYTGQFDSEILTQDPRPILGGVTGGVDVFTLMRINTDAVNPIQMAFPIARGMTAPNVTIGTQ